ncbi:MAG: hypothetical protein KAG66_21550, partial [Methylococcales bacterium]|nr:hypothetical protein [Methylococcales bacterium]
ANLPGLTGNTFTSENHVSVRANSPRGLKYRIDGIDIPNPNHFARIGSSGGTFTIFSNQILGSSDFFTAAWPAMYGDASAGVFDINFRVGNAEKREFALQAGLLGFDLSAEGPFKKGGKSSYLVNYRFSSLTVANLFIDYKILPEFQDISFKLHFPTKKAGIFPIFGIGGISQRLRPEEEDSTLWKRDIDRFRLELASDMAALGLTHRLLLGKKTIWQSAIAASYLKQKDNKTYLEDDHNLRLRDRNEYEGQPTTLTSSLKHNFSKRFTQQTGFSITTSSHKHITLDYDYIHSRLDTLVNAKGRSLKIQLYTQSRIALSDRLRLHAGLHYLSYDLNDAQVIEPRFGLAFDISEGHRVAAGYGLHHQAEDFANYMLRIGGQENSRDLELMQSQHWVLSYYGRILKNHKLRLELYYQKLNDIPVEPGTSFALINLNELDHLRRLNNDGTGQNMGIDLGFERYTDNGVYYLINTSLFSSTYTGGDGVKRSTAFDSRFKVNFL